MTLKEIIAHDNRNTFLQECDFSETHNIEGKMVEMSVDEDRAEDRVDVSTGARALVLYARTEDLPTRRLPGDTIRFDNSEAMVISWTENMGISCVTIAQNRTV